MSSDIIPWIFPPGKRYMNKFSKEAEGEHLFPKVYKILKRKKSLKEEAEIPAAAVFNRNLRKRMLLP
jgi:hypothetical protein